MLIVWHGSDGDTLTERSPIKSDLTAAIIRIRPHGAIPGWFIVSLQSCYERLMHPRKFARLRVDPFSLGLSSNREIGLGNMAIDGIFGLGFSSLQGSGILVPRGSLGIVTRAIAVTAWRQAHLINCVRSSINNNNNNNNNSINSLMINPLARINFDPESVRKDRIGEIVKRLGMQELPYDQFLIKIFSLQ